MDCSIDEDEEEIASGEVGYLSCDQVVLKFWYPGIDWLPGDEFAAICRVSLAPEEETGEDDAIVGPGEYEISWRRCGVQL